MEICLINNKAYPLTKYALDKDQIWKAGSGRSEIDLKWRGVVYNFTNLDLEVFVLDKQSLKDLETDLLSGDINVKFYDTRTDTVREAQFYRANYKVDIKGFYDEGTQTFYDKIPISFVAKEKENV